MNKLAQINFYEGGGYTGFGPLGLEGGVGAQNAGFTLASVITSTVGIITIVAIIWFVFIIITGALSMMAAGADKGAAEGARKRITNGTIGLVGVVVGIFIVQLIGMILGFPNILNLPALIEAVQIQ